MAFDLDGILILDEEELLPELEDEIANVLDNLILQHFLIHVLDVVGVQFLHIDEVQQILVLEGADGAAGATDIRDGGEEVVGKGPAMMVIICFDGLDNTFLCQVRHCRKPNIKEAFLLDSTPKCNALKSDSITLLS